MSKEKKRKGTLRLRGNRAPFRGQHPAEADPDILGTEIGKRHTSFQKQDTFFLSAREKTKPWNPRAKIHRTDQTQITRSSRCALLKTCPQIGESPACWVPAARTRTTFTQTTNTHKSRYSNSGGVFTRCWLSPSWGTRRRPPRPVEAHSHRPLSALAFPFSSRPSRSPTRLPHPPRAEQTL